MKCTPPSRGMLEETASLFCYQRVRVRESASASPRPRVRVCILSTPVFTGLGLVEAEYHDSTAKKIQGLYHEMR